MPENASSDNACSSDNYPETHRYLGVEREESQGPVPSLNYDGPSVLQASPDVYMEVVRG